MEEHSTPARMEVSKPALTIGVPANTKATAVEATSRQDLPPSASAGAALNSGRASDPSSSFPALEELSLDEPRPDLVKQASQDAASSVEEDESVRSGKPLSSAEPVIQESVQANHHPAAAPIAHEVGGEHAPLLPTAGPAPHEEEEDEEERVARELEELEAEAKAQALQEQRRGSGRLTEAPQPPGPDDAAAAFFTPERRNSDTFSDQDLTAGEDVSGVERALNQAHRLLADTDAEEQLPTSKLQNFLPQPPARPFSPPPGGAATRIGDPSSEPAEFRGMLYCDGIDSLGRPVIVVNAESMGHYGRASRRHAMEYIIRRLEPVVQKGPYVLVMVATMSGSSSGKAPRLPAMFLVSAYRNLSRPFRKNVKYIVMVRPSAALRAMLAVIRPFLSPKAAKKLKKVDSLSQIGATTNEEVHLQHLGPRFAAAAGQYVADRGSQPPQPPGGTSGYASTHIHFHSGF